MKGIVGAGAKNLEPWEKFVEWPNEAYADLLFKKWVQAVVLLAFRGLLAACI